MWNLLEFALKLPGFSLKVLGYLGGEDSLRYVHEACSFFWFFFPRSSNIAYRS